VKLSEGSRRKRRTPFLREEAEGRPSFGRKPKDVLFSKQVQKAEGRALFKTSSLPSGSARGEAFRRKPKVAKQVQKGRPSLPSASFGKLHLWRFPKEAKQVHVLLSFFQKGRPPELLSERASSPPEVKLSEGRRHPARGEAFRRKPKEAEGSEGRPSFGRKPKDVLFSKQVQKAEGRAFFKTSSHPSASFGKPPPRQR